MDRTTAALTLVAVSLFAFSRPAAAASAEEAVTVCTRQLQSIGRALDACRRKAGELPALLSDLHPRYLAETEAFHCPADSSPGKPGTGPPDPKLPISYLYEMNTEKVGSIGVQLGPRQFGPEATWRENKQAQQVHFGDYVPVVTCFHHEGFRLNLTPSGKVYRSQRFWEADPVVLPHVLDRMQQDLSAGPLAFTRSWSLPAVERYSAQWLETPLPPALRHQLGVVADPLAAAANGFSTGDQSAVFRLSALFHRGAGQKKQALAATREALRRSPDDDSVKYLVADLRRGTGGRKAPPLDLYLKAEMARHHVPGVSIAVVRDGKVVLAKGYGQANVEHAVPATPESVYEIGSITKQFTATAIMMLVEEGKLSLDDRISVHLTDLPAAWRDVTVRQLLTHTSGIKSYTSVPELWKSVRLDLTKEEILKLVSDAPLEFQPDERYSYNNTGYFLLGMIIEKASGKGYGQFLRERIFDPLQMTSTRVNDFRDLVKNRACGYNWENGKLRNADYLSPTAPYAAGALVSTVLDLARWDAALAAGKLLKPLTWEQMWTPAKLKSGKPIEYGFGWVVARERGRRVLQHGGGIYGFVTHIRRYVDDRLTVVVLTNLEGGDPAGWARRIAAFYLPAPRSIDDSDPAMTRRFQRIVQELMAGRAAGTEFTSEARARLLSRLTEARGFYTSLGQLKSFQLLETADTPNGRAYRYQSVYRNGTWVHHFQMEGDRIAQLTVEPE